MNPWHGLTPEQHQALVRKAQATRKANREKLEQEKLEMETRGDVLLGKVRALEKRLIELSKYEELSTLSAALNDRALLLPEEIIKGAIPFTLASGVYFLVDNGEIVYVGQSVNVYSRISQHGIKFDKFAFVPCPVNLLDRLESFYIHVLRPRSNGNFNAQEKSAPIRFNKLLNMEAA
jgi:hypothetical protein